MTWAPFLLLAQAAAPTAPVVLQRLDLLPPDRRCDPASTADGDILVCARIDQRHRLPLPSERDTAVRDGPVRGEPARASIDGSAPCGLFGGQRRTCSKAEAARYGYGGGRDPLTVGAKALRALLDPDAATSEPTPDPH